MNFVADAAIRVSIVLGATLAASAVCRRQSAACRHFVLAGGIVCAIGSPVLRLTVPSWHVVFTQSTAERPVMPPVDTMTSFAPAPGARPTSSSTRAVPNDSRATVGRLIGFAWTAGCVASLAMLLIGLVRLRFVGSRSTDVEDASWVRVVGEIAKAYGVRRPIVLLESQHPTLIVTWGVVHPKIIIPASAREWSADRIRLVLSHELAHIRRGDWLVQIVAELLRSFYWFNPLVWIACSRLRHESERACDDAVLNLGFESTAYATHLVDLARIFSRHRRVWLPAPAVVQPSSFERRIHAMLNAQLNRTPLTRAARAAAVIALLAFTLTTSTFGAQAFGTIAGTIADQFGGFLPNATLTLSQVGTQTRHEVRSDASGLFQFVGLPAGEYLLQTEMPGFAKSQDRLTMAGGQTLQRNVVLQVGALQETITVREAAEGAPPPTSSAVLQKIQDAGRALDQAKPCVPSPVGGRIVPPMKLRDVKPEYPQNLQGSGESRAIVLSAVIGTDGYVKDARASTPVDPNLENAAAVAVRQWRFTPTLLNCVPVEVSMTVTVNFKSRE